MGSIIFLVSFAIQSLNMLMEWAKTNPWSFVAIVGSILVIKKQKDYSQAQTFLLAQSGYSVIDGDFSRGKTRLLTLLAEEAKRMGMFVLCNFYNKSESVRWNSKGDLIRLLCDMWLLGEYQNYDEKELEEMYRAEGKERVKQKMAERKTIARKYPSIPKSGFHSRFFIAGDEMQNIFYNRNAAENFAGENKPFLKLLHQVRHFNAVGAFALTDANEFDKKFRKISKYYITFGDAFSEGLLKYDVYTFETDKENNLDMERAKRMTKSSVYKLNGYVLNKAISWVEKTVRRKIKFRFAELGFFSKFNCDPDTDVYVRGDLFKYLEKHYRENPWGGVKSNV